MATGLVVALLSVLLGCSLGPTSSPVHVVTSTPGPASEVSTSTVTGTASCAPRSALPQGWTWYEDARYPFRVAAPPTWRTGSFEYTPSGDGLGTASPEYSHVVDFFGPESVGQSLASGGKDRADTSSPVITITVGVGQDARIDGFTQNAAFHAQPTPVCVGGALLALYVFTNSQGDVERAALLPSGPDGYAYAFLVASQAGTAARDGQIFLTALGTFGDVAGG